MTNKTQNTLKEILKNLRAGIWEEASGQAQFQETITVEEAKAAIYALMEDSLNRLENNLMNKAYTNTPYELERCDAKEVYDEIAKERNRLKELM